MTELERIRNEMSEYAKNNYTWDTLYSYTIIQRLLTVIEKQSEALNHYATDESKRQAKVWYEAWNSAKASFTLAEIEKLLKEIK